MSRESRDGRETDETHWECSMINVELSGLAGRPVGGWHPSFWCLSPYEKRDKALPRLD